MENQNIICSCIAHKTYKTWHVSLFSVIAMLYGHFCVLSPCIITVWAQFVAKGGWSLQYFPTYSVLIRPEKHVNTKRLIIVTLILIRSIIIVYLFNPKKILFQTCVITYRPEEKWWQQSTFCRYWRQRRRRRANGAGRTEPGRRTEPKPVYGNSLTEPWAS